MIVIPLTKGYETIVDDLDEDLNRYCWQVQFGHNGNKYAVGMLGRMHRVIMKRILGRDIENYEIVDHKNLVGLHNLRHNLRLVDASNSKRNSHIPNTNTSGYRGVSRESNKWRSKIGIRKKIFNLGLYDTIEEASRVYVTAYYEAWGEYPPESIKDSLCIFP